MSMIQDYEKLGYILGNKKYEAIDDYIKEFGKAKEYDEGVKRLRPIENIKEWEHGMLDLHKKCKPIFVEDVVMNKEEWMKFESWYKQRKLNRSSQNKKDLSNNKVAKKRSMEAR